MRARLPPSSGLMVAAVALGLLGLTVHDCCHLLLSADGARLRTAVLYQTTTMLRSTTLQRIAPGLQAALIDRSIRRHEAPPEATLRVPPGQVRLMLVGDLLPLHDRDYLQAIAPLLREADMAVCNLECPLATGGTPTPLKLRDGRLMPGQFLFRADPVHAGRMAEAGFDVATLANNHTMDYGPQALLETLQVLDAAGIAHTGAGQNLTQARMPVIRRIGAQTVAILAYVCASTLPGTEHWAATERTAGVAFVHPGADDMPGDQTRHMLQQDLAAAREQADLLIVCYHWGTEARQTPDPFTRNLARLSVDWGADAVVGHHPHMPQGVELYRGRPIVYSLGNFVFPTRFRHLLPSFILEIRLKEGRWHELMLHPIMLRHGIGDPHPATGAEGERILRHIAELSEQLGTASRLHSGESPTLLIANPEAAAPRQTLLHAEREQFRISPCERVPGMSVVHLLAWDMEAGEKVARPRQVTVADALAAEVLEIFRQIYLDPERFAIHELVGYHFRTVTGGRGLSLHALGRAVDINRAQNPMLIDGEPAVHPREPPYTPGPWRPGSDPYSIPPDGSVVRIFEAHGWRWGGRWSASPDYQHFDKPTAPAR